MRLIGLRTLKASIPADARYLVQCGDHSAICVDLCSAAGFHRVGLYISTAFMHSRKILLCGNKFRRERTKLHRNFPRERYEWNCFGRAPNSYVIYGSVKTGKIRLENIIFTNFQCFYALLKQVSKNSNPFGEARSSNLSQCKFLTAAIPTLGRRKQHRAYEGSHSSHGTYPRSPVCFVQAAPNAERDQRGQTDHSERRVSHDVSFEIVEIDCHKGILPCTTR